MNENVIKFVKLVEAFPCLYNHSISEYSRKDITEKVWAEISLKMNWTVPECKEKWRNVRNGFVKSLKAPPSGSAAKSRKHYYLHDEMQFVIPFVKPTNNGKEPGNIPACHSSQSTANNLSEVDTQSTSTNEVETQRTSTNEVETQRASTNDELVDASTQPPKKKAKPSNNVVNSTFMQYITAKRQNMEKSMQKADTENPRKMFLLSLLPDIENLNNNNMRLLKIEIMSLIQKYQILQAQSNSQIYQQPCQQPYTPVSSAMSPDQQQPCQPPYSSVSSAMSPNQQQPCQQPYTPVSSAMSPDQQQPCQQPYSSVSSALSPNQQQPFQQLYSPVSSAMSPYQQGDQLLRSPLDYSTSRDECPPINVLNELTQYNWNEHNS